MALVLYAAEDACKAFYCAEPMDAPMLALRDALDADSGALRAEVFNALALVRMEAKQAGGAAAINLASAQRSLEAAWARLEPQP